MIVFRQGGSREIDVQLIHGPYRNEAKIFTASLQDGQRRIQHAIIRVARFDEDRSQVTLDALVEALFVTGDFEDNPAKVL